MQFAALLHDVVSALSVMSQVFQRKDATYVVKHYEGSFLRAGVAVNSVEFEWTLLKNNLYSEPEEVKNLTWPEINRRWKSHYGNILAVVDLLLCLPSSSAECERI